MVQAVRGIRGGRNVFYLYFATDAQERHSTFEAWLRFALEETRRAY